MKKKSDGIIDVNHLFQQLYDNSIPELLALQKLEILTDNYHDTNIACLINDLDKFRIRIRMKQIERSNEVRKSNLYKLMVKNNVPVPYLEWIDSLKNKGIKKSIHPNDLAYMSIEYVETFFPDVKEKLDNLTTWIHTAIESKAAKHWKSKLEKIDRKVLTNKSHLNLQWVGEPIELVELIKALIEAKRLSPQWTERTIFDVFERFFGFPLNYKERLKTIKRREEDTDKSILPELVYVMDQWMAK